MFDLIKIQLKIQRNILKRNDKQNKIFVKLYYLINYFMGSNPCRGIDNQLGKVKYFSVANILAGKSNY